MKTRKRYLAVGGIVLVVMLLAGFGFVAACGPCRGFEGGFHPGLHQKHFLDFVLWRLDKGVEELNLTEAQKGKYGELKEEFKARLKELMDERKRWREELQIELSKENPDARALSESAKQRIERFSGFMEENLDLIVEFYETLDQQQKEKVLAMVRERMKRCPVAP